MPKAEWFDCFLAFGNPIKKTRISFCNGVSVGVQFQTKDIMQVNITFFSVLLSNYRVACNENCLRVFLNLRRTPLFVSSGHNLHSLASSVFLISRHRRIRWRWILQISVTQKCGRRCRNCFHSPTLKVHNTETSWSFRFSEIVEQRAS